jgi:hypothetical protein
MAANPFANFRARPLEVGEWEDLLLRFELGPRAIRIALDDHSGAPETLLACCARLVSAELRCSRALEAMQKGGTVPPGPDAPAEPGSAGAMLKRLVEIYAAARARNFAALQRRGLEVWDWTAPLEEGGEVTAAQLVRYGLQVDGDVLGEVRSAGRGVAAC